MFNIRLYHTMFDVVADCVEWSVQGCDLELLAFGKRPALVSADPQVEDVTDVCTQAG